MAVVGMRAARKESRDKLAISFSYVYATYTPRIYLLAERHCITQIPSDSFRRAIDGFDRRLTRMYH